MGDMIADWPDDADGDVFRRLASSGFDFSKSWIVDFNVDFASWPPTESALELLHSMFGELRIFPPDENGDGYVQFQILGPLRYETVVTTQKRASAAMFPFNGTCDSWGVMH